MRIRESDVLDLLAVGLTAEQVVEELPDLERDDVGVEVVAVCDLGLRSAEDPAIFAGARTEGAVVLTKDSDFVDLVARWGPPPQIIMAHVRKYEQCVFPWDSPRRVAAHRDFARGG